MHNQTTNYDHLVDLLRYRATHEPDKVAYIFLKEGETPCGSLTYQQLDLQAQAIASQLQSLVTRGSRALLLYPYNAGLEFIAAFFGCLYAEVIPVNTNPPRSHQSWISIQQRVIASGASMALSTTDFLAQFSSQSAQNSQSLPQLTQLTWLATDNVSTSLASAWCEPELTKDSLAFLQYTSGSTGLPKGVMVTHANLLHNCALIYNGFEHTPHTKGLIWLPLFHDMGLIGGVIQPLYAGLTVILTSPVAFIQKPLRWLEAISRYQVTTSGGPNFAYDLLCQKITPEQKQDLDLSSWEVAFSGAEPVRAQTLERFSHTFAECGFRREAFYPCYGMAETTLFISGGQKTDLPIIEYVDGSALETNQVVAVGNQDEKARAIVGCGHSWLGDRIAIVDPESLIEYGEDRVGEIWVAGTGVGKGYWNQPEETEKTFRAYLADTQEGPFLRTGDLGFIHHGELFITGRIKDLMILWGRNYYPQHLEQTVEKCHQALRANSGAAFAVEAEGEERLVIAFEVERTYLRKLDVDEVVGAIRQGIAQEYVVDVYAIVLLKTGSIPKTSSGKIQRRACKAKFIAGELDKVGEWRQLQAQQRGMTELMGGLNIDEST